MDAITDARARVVFPPDYHSWTIGEQVNFLPRIEARAARMGHPYVSQHLDAALAELDGEAPDA